MGSFDKIIKMKDDYKALIKAEGEIALKEFMREFFERAEGKISAVTWRQYTPYFNDGDACEFSVHEPYFLMATKATEGEEVYSDYDDDFISTWQIEKRKDVLLYDLTCEFTRTLDKLEDILFEAFGDHVKITATPEKVTVEDYDHD